MLDGPKTNTVLFATRDASNTLGHNPTATGLSGEHTSHNWGGFSTAQPAAGSATPATTFYTSRYGISTGRTTCSICHDPHLDVTVAGQEKLLRKAVTNDLICQQCHQQWFVANANALLTHPIVFDYAATAGLATNAGKLRPTLTNVGSGDVRLVNGGVSCTSCHSTHYTDSSSATVDGRAAYGSATLAVGDGNLLRSDGLINILPVNQANQIIQAQRRSNLCQACHTYLVHGNTADGGPQIGCLDCHGGHSYNGGVPNVFVLSGSASTPQPRNANAVGTSTFPPYTAPYAGASNEVWSNKAVGIGGYCEECHGDVQAAPISGKSTGHSVGNPNGCTTCHMHGGSGWTHSWQPDVSAATCGDCHGFPPYLSVPGDRNTGGTEGGYALSESEGTPAPWDYLNDSDSYKLEATTAHNTHAGGSATNPGYYFVGSTGTENCNVCHGDNAGFNAQHRDDTRANSFRDVTFNSVATHSGALTPSYKTGNPNIWTCSNVYCHTNGGPRDNAGVQTFKTNVTPAWDTANGGGKNAIFGKTTPTHECAFCHGNSVVTMELVTGKENSQAHDKHLNKGYTCNVCHAYTAASNTAMTAGATRGNLGGNNGKHVNGTIDVNYDTTYNLGAATLTAGATPYTAANGTCQVYCHSNGAGTYAAPDWQVAGIGCTSCHGNPPTSGSHAKHVTAANGPLLACNKCHVNAGTYTTAGGHADHQNGAVTVDSTRCTTCHGYDSAQGETLPVWGATPYTDPDPAKRDDYCIACHTGTTTPVLASGGIAAGAPAKASALLTGHGKASGFYADGAGGNGNGAANRACTVCHDSSAAGHFDGTSNDDKRLILGSNGFPAAYSTIADQNNYCGACHGAAPGHPTPSTRTGINTHQAKACVGCHDPHGSSNILMVRPTSTGNYNGTVVFSARTGADSFDEDDNSDKTGASAGVENNADDLCATCHSNAAGTLHNNRDNSSTLHNQALDCFTCHKTHTDATAPFGAGAGNACNDCHGNPPATAAHGRHALVASHDKDIEDRTDCAFCHTGADLYTYDPSADQGAGRNHGNAAGRKTLLGTSVGYVVANGTCTSACHTSTAGTDGFWSDANGLNCTACHSYPPAGNNHGKHIAAGMTCAGCHVGVDAAGTTPLTHADLGDTTGAGDDPATDILKIQHKGNAYVNVSGLDAELDDSAWNAGGGSTFVNGAGTTNNTCSNTLCHDPSNNGTAADWDSSTASCALCHGAGTTMTTGSHANHLNNAAVIGDNFACTVCHPDNSALGTDHTLDVSNTQGVVTIGGSKANTYGGEVSLPTSAYGTCTASQCHNDGKGANVASPAWGRAPQSADNCTICHAAPPANGDHPGHWVAGRQSLGLGCTSCHFGTTATDSTIKSGNLHLNGSSYNVVAGGTYNAVTVTISSYVQGSPSTCTASCHAANPKNWAPATSCNGCHGNPPATGAHAKHATVTDQTTAEDRTDCAQCHPGADTYTYAAGGTHQTGVVNVAAGWSDNGTPANKNDDTCASACHLTNGGTDGFWGDSNGLDCAACHYYSAAPTGAGNSAHAKGISTNSHNKHFDKSKLCTDCHGALENGGSSVAGPLTHITASGANQGAILAGKAAAAQDEANVTRTSMTWTDASNTCANNGGGLALGCHATGSPVWGTVGPLACIACHTDETTAAVNPTSGLHNFTVATRHDDTLQTGACVNCHDVTSPSSLHQNGTMNNSTVATYTFNATKVLTYSNANGCQANCHADGGDWKRRWIGAVNLKPGVGDNPGAAVCANCHGDFSNGWRWNEANASTTDHTDPNGDLTDQMSSNHGTCQNCHGWGDAGYDKTWSTGKHGDGLITLNGPAPATGAAYDNTTGGCALSCHGDIAGRRLNSNSGWTANYGNYGAGACFSCHGNGTSQYWPDGATYPDKAGRHATHITRLAAKLGITLPGTDLEQKRLCAYCHNDAAGVGGSGHNTDSVPTGVADVGAINPIWDATNPPTVADAGSSFNTTDGSCSGIDCHNNKTLPAGTFGWRNATVTTCTMCHTAGGASNDPTSGLHNLTPTVSGVRHDNTLSTGCTVCHTAIPTPGSGTHINNAFTGNGTVAGDRTNMGLIADYTATADGIGSCSGATVGGGSCHAGAGDAGSWARKWNSAVSGQTNGTECQGCHGGFAGTDWTFGAAHNISDNNVEHNYSWDGDGPVEIVGNHKNNLANTSRCNVCHVYGDAGYVFGTNHRNGQLEMNSTRGYSTATWNCTSSCHISNTNHNLEASGWTVNPVAGPALACDSCHGNGGEYWPNDIGNTNYPNRKGRHLVHMQKLAVKLGYTLPGSDLEQKAMCDYCHNDASGSGGTGHDDRVAPANVGSFNLIWSAASDANGGYNSTAPGTCSNIDCHNSKATTAGTFGWYDSATVTCLLCHTPGAGNNPSSGLHNLTPTISGQRHDTTVSGGCIACHTALPAMSPTTTHPNGTFSGNGTLAADRTNMGLFAAYTTSGTDNTGTCAGGLVGGASCHAGTGDAGTWARKWNSAISGQTNGTECQGCHGGFAGTDWTFGSTHNIADGSTEHNYNWDGDGSTEIIGNHKDNVANTSRCSICHVYGGAPYATLATYHRNGTIEMNSTVEYSTSNFNCTGACHAANNVNHNLDTSGWTVNPIAGTALACSSCHGGGTTQGGGLFNYWPDGASYPDIAGRHTIHITRLAAKLGYTMGALTDVQQKAMCDYCHNDAAGAGGTGHNDSVSPANTGSFNHIGTGAVDGGTAGTIAAGVCSNVDCHNNKATSGGYTWTGASTSVCLMCHTLGGASNDPTSGLHNVVPTTTGQTHDDSFATGGTCTSCHTALPAMSTTTTHINGAFTGNGTIAGDKTNMGLFTAYTATADNIGTCSGAGVGGANCHVNIMDAGSWARLWDASIPGQTNGTECKGCHGGMSGNDWTFGNDGVTADNSTSHNKNWDADGNVNEVYGNHKDGASNATKCNICHVYGDPQYVWATNHRNGKITMNSATTYSSTTWNCTQVCHVSNTNHNLEAAASAVWATRGESLAGPALACYTCHGGGTANSGSGFNYWPDGTTYPDIAGGSGTNRHLAHITKLAAKLGYTMATLTDQQQKTMCGYCHPTIPGAAGHNDNISPANVASADFNPLWSAITSNYPSTADNATVAATWTTGTQQCSGIDCHNNKATTGTFAWNSTATSSCLLCHTLGGAGSNPTSGLHNVVPNTSGAAGQHDDSFATGGTCTSCHTALPAVSPTSTHINSTFTGNGTIAGDKTNMGLFAAYTATADNVGTCSGAGVASAGCHGDGVAVAQKGDAGTWKRIWDSNVNNKADGTECKSCHGGLAGTDWTFGVTSGAANTGDTNTDHMASYDGDGTSNEIAGNHSGTTQTTRCVNCHVYGEGAYVWATKHRNNTIEVNSALGMTTSNRTCTSYCHSNNTGHVLDAGGWTVATLAGSPLSCSTCHAITTHTDANGDGLADACTSCHTDHNISPANDRTGVNAANNVYISTIYGRTVVGGYGNDTGTLIPTMNNQYASHDSWIQLGGTAITWGKTTEAETCWACHDSLTASRKTLTGVNVTFTSPATIAATGIDTKFNVGDWITITGSSNAANNRTFKVATKAAGSLTITNQAGDATLTTVASAAGVTIVSPISEWGVNEDTATGASTYDYGELYTDTTSNTGTRTSNWTTGYWRSGKGRIGAAGAYNPYWYKRGAVKSTHSVNYDGTTPANVEGTNWKALTSGANATGYNRTETVDAVGNIHCTYCHDVHGTHNGVNGDAVGTPDNPYLRGTWKGNPYAEDGAPQWGMASYQIQGAGTQTLDGSSSSQYGIVPRASAGSANSGSATVAKVGGFWIDQNSGNPNSGSSATLTAGLCDQCHGSAAKDGTWTAAEIGSIDQITGEGLWVSGASYNGHANSVISGAGGNNGTAPAAASAEIRARNIFTRTLRGYSTLQNPQANNNATNMGLVGASQGYSYRGAGSGYVWYPRVFNTTVNGTTAGRPYAFSYFAWSGGTSRTSSSNGYGTALTQPTTTGAEAAHDAQLNFHTFTCSKCHNPHASRLPKLMITNCLDTNHNTWEDNSAFTGTALASPWTGLRHSQWASAQNCHRVDARAALVTSPVTTLGTGWNKATPWQEYTAPNTATGTNPNP